MKYRKLEQSEMLELTADFELEFGTYKANFFQRVLILMCKHSFLKRGSFRKLLTRVILSLGKSKLDISFRGAAYRILGEKNLIEYGLLLNPDYNSVEIDFLLEGAKSGSNFIDIGCNIGLYSLPLALASRSGKTLAIDANPKMIGRIQWNATASDLDNLISIHSAVGDVNGYCNLLIGKEDVAIVAIEENTEGKIPIRLLHDIIIDENIKTIYGLKIDIEGHEDKALVPFFNSAPKYLLPKKIVIEHPSMHSDYTGCVAEFIRLGYELRSRTRNNSLYELLD